MRLNVKITAQTSDSARRLLAHALWRRRQETAAEEKKIDAGKDTGRSLKVVDGQGQRKEEGDGRKV